ncbi:membrane fusion protein, multidrug efflux system [Kaistia soli DSM 19436]|uniref:Membrane fusion protein, multidrug efflux system n=1 Tax=Kaistia soli DSM 19436 TaxID=1122133 RepID=A0A1M4WVR1_9HYPH|nr:HlyD family secretion protein [Kaistia soli]SHE85300.1 membrane fusion protein, multidrug efflux system [Kaistia soli DSM 19436]
MLRRLLDHPVRLIVGIALALFLAYEVSVQFFAYTGDAYITTDVVVLSAEVAGPIDAIHVENNQAVAAGDGLFSIEATPYQLAVTEAEAVLAQAKAGQSLAGDQVGAAKADVASAQAVLDNANATLTRVRSLSGQGFSTDASLDEAIRDAATANANLLVAQSGLGVANQRVTVAAADESAAEAALATARYRLSKTNVAAPTPGRIAPFTRRRGDSLSPGTEVMAIVTAERPRIVANVAERHLSHLALGQPAFVTIGSRPWHVLSGHVSGIAAGIARSQEAQRIIPYVDPTTDWVRLPRRFPVEITLDDLPPDTALPLGADARVLIRF